MDTELSQKIAELEQKVDKIFISVEKTRKYFLWTAIITVAVIVLPLIGLIFVIPSFVSNYTTSLQGL